MWNADAGANRLNPTYIDSYLDVSGGTVTVRGNLNMETGTIQMSNKVYNQPYTFDLDISLNSRFFVAGDVSMSAPSSLNVAGDISINGFLSAGSYLPGSISLNALASTGGGSGGSGFSTLNGVTTIKTDMLYTNSIQMDADISMNVFIEDGFNDPTSVFKITDKINTLNLVGGGTTTGSRSWSAIGISSTGQYIIAAVSAGNIWISIDSGGSWRELNGASGDYAQVTGATQSWTHVAISGDGSIMIAKKLGGALYRSIDYGKTWYNITYNGITYQEANDQGTNEVPIVMSSDGKYIYSWTFHEPGNYNFATSNPKMRFIYSHDGGANWVSVSKTRSPMKSISTSKSGKYVIIISYAWNELSSTANIKYSNNYGVDFNLFTSLIGLTEDVGTANFAKSYVLDNGQAFIASTKTNNFRRYDLSNATITPYDLSNNQSNAPFTVLNSLPQGYPVGLYATEDGKDIAYVTTQSTGQPRFNHSIYSADYGASFKYFVNNRMVSYYVRSQNGTPPQYAPSMFSLFEKNKDVFVIYHFAGFIYISQIRKIKDNNPNSTLQFNSTTTLKHNQDISAIQFGDGSIISSSNIASGSFKNNNVVFKDSSFNNMTVIGSFSSSQLTDPSDYRIKTDVQTLNETHVVDNLRPVMYYQTQLAQNQIGFLAHELQEYYPELVDGEKDGNILQSVNYNGLLAVLIHEIQQLKTRIANKRNTLLLGNNSLKS
jgi:hypothetical protein